MGLFGSLKNFIVGAPGAGAAGGQPPTIVQAVPNTKMITSTMDQEQLGLGVLPYRGYKVWPSGA
jgi:hypothetical protein